jgi:hypothetical protein
MTLGVRASALVSTILVPLAGPSARTGFRSLRLFGHELSPCEASATGIMARSALSSAFNMKRTGFSFGESNHDWKRFDSRTAGGDIPRSRPNSDLLLPQGALRRGRLPRSEPARLSSGDIAAVTRAGSDAERGSGTLNRHLRSSVSEERRSCNGEGVAMRDRNKSLAFFLSHDDSQLRPHR